MLTVEKIGGTSMSNFGQVLENIIKKSDSPNSRILVVSAYAGITDLLLEHKKNGQPGVYALFAEGKDYANLLNEVSFKMQEINAELEKVGLNRQLADEYLRFRINSLKRHLNGMSAVIASGYTDKKIILQSARELLASIGEVHSAFNSVQILKNHGYSANFADLSGFGDADSLTLDERIIKTFKEIEYQNSITVTTGYTRGTEGIMNSFDRGYSEVSFSKIAALLSADEAIIHKEFHLSSADPKIIGENKAKPVCYTSYEIAGHLANIGMEAIHPACARVISDAGINLRIKNTFEPDHPGTLISNLHNAEIAGIQIISGCDKIVRLELTGCLQKKDPETVFNTIIGSIGVSPILKTVNQNNISLLLNEKEFSADIEQNLAANFTVCEQKQAALINILGSKLNTQSILTRTVQIFSQHNIVADYLSVSLRQINFQLLIERKDYSRAIQLLHREFCE